MAVEQTFPAEAPTTSQLGPATGASAGKRHGLARWLLWRFAWGIVALFVVSVFIFILTHVLPSDPARAILGHFAEPAQLQLVTRELGLDKPLPSQYLSWIGGVIHGDFGVSFATKAPVLSLVGPRLENSLTLLVVVAL